MRAILGTAGHIDHGKTALVRALTGQDTDRLAEEKERGISIDLGFAHLDLPSGARVGIVDVPGHERFIRNMLAGAQGIDLVLLVVAADDGVMPQTEEHLEIVDLLGVERGLAVITKADLVAAPRLAEVERQIASLLRGTRLAAAPTVAVSSLTGDGIAALVAAIEAQLASIPSRESEGVFRLPIDRAFVMRGHGVVVTGTAVCGRVRIGDALRLLPGGEECRVRALQVHGAEVVEAAAGQRVAVNLAGVERTDVSRGHMLVDARFGAATRRLDAAIEVLARAPRGLRNHGAVRVHLGTAAVRARLHLLDERAELAPCEHAYAQLALEDEVATVLGDRFVLRDETGQRTLGGGVVLHPAAVRHRRGDGTSVRLRQIESPGDPGSRWVALVGSGGDVCLSLDELAQLVPLSLEAILAALRAEPRLVLLPNDDSPEAVATREAIEALEVAVLEAVAAAHRAAPLAPGLEMESARTQVAPTLSAKLFRSLLERLERRGALTRQESVLRLPEHRVALTAPEESLARRAEAILAAAELAPPDLRTLDAELRAPREQLVAVLAQLEREGRVARVAPDLYFARPALEQARALLAEYLREHGEISAAVFRDLIHGSRKFSIALLDYFDRTGFTLRVGDLRKLRRL